MSDVTKHYVDGHIDDDKYMMSNGTLRDNTLQRDLYKGHDTIEPTFTPVLCCNRIPSPSTTNNICISDNIDSNACYSRSSLHVYASNKDKSGLEQLTFRLDRNHEQEIIMKNTTVLHTQEEQEALISSMMVNKQKQLECVCCQQTYGGSSGIGSGNGSSSSYQVDDVD